MSLFIMQRTGKLGVHVALYIIRVSRHLTPTYMYGVSTEHN